MYSRAFVAATLVAAAAPALALPVAPTTAQTDASGALNLNIIKDAVDIGGKVISGIDSIKNLFSSNDNQQRDFEELLARASTVDSTTDQSGAISFDLIKDVVDIGGKVISGIDGIKNIFSSNNNQRREFEELLARAAVEDASGAISFQTIKDIGSIGGSLFNAFQGVKDIFSKREIEDLLARADAADPSGALSLSLVKDVVDIGGKVISGIDGIKNLFSSDGNQRRDFEELLARELTTDESGAISFGSIINIGSSIINGLSSFLGGGNNKRELMNDPVAREFHDLLVREEESGALNIGSLVKTGISLFSSLFGGDNNNKRDVPSTPAPAPAPIPSSVAAKYTDASGAFDFGTFAKDAFNVVTTVAPFFLKREELDALLARDAAAAAPSTPAAPTTINPANYVDASGAFDFGTFAKDAFNVVTTVAPFFLKREELDTLLARDATPAPATPTPTAINPANYVDASGAFDLGKFAKDAFSVVSTVAPFFLKREEMDLLAREFPQLNGHPLFRIGTVLPPQAGSSLNALD